MKKTIIIDGIEVPMKCTGATPSFYRELFKRDLFLEFARMSKAFVRNEAGELSTDFSSFDFSIVEDLAYTMAYQADREIGTKMEWLDQFEHTSAIFDAMDQILDLYTNGLTTTSDLKKKESKQIGR